MIRPGTLSSSSANTITVEDIIKKNLHVTVKEIATITDISVGSACSTIQDVIHFNKVSVRLVPHQLVAELKYCCFDACGELCVICRLKLMDL